MHKLSNIFAYGCLKRRLCLLIIYVISGKKKFEFCGCNSFISCSFCIFYCFCSYMTDIPHFQVCVNLDKQKEKQRLAQNWKRKKHEEKKRQPLILPFICFTCSLVWALFVADFQKFLKERDSNPCNSIIGTNQLLTLYKDGHIPKNWGLDLGPHLFILCRVAHFVWVTCKLHLMLVLDGSG